MGKKRKDPNEWSSAVAAQVRAERVATGLTQEEVFERADIPQSTYLHIESGERVPNIVHLDAIAHALGIRLTTLIDRAEQRL